MKSDHLTCGTGGHDGFSVRLTVVVTCREIPYIPYGKCSAILGITGSSTQLPDPVEHSFDLLLVVRDEVGSRRQMDAVLAENLHQFIAQRQSLLRQFCDEFSEEGSG